MDLSALWLAVRNRAKADTGAGGLFAPGAYLISDIYENDWPEAVPLPIVVYDVAGTENLDGFRNALEKVLVRFSVYVRTDPVVSTEATATASKIINRLEGDWPAQSYGTGPTFGFDRWIGTLSSSNWTKCMMIRRGTRAEHSAGVLHYVLDFEVHLTRAGA